jgi:curli production assembly/transport component CsgG
MHRRALYLAAVLALTGCATTADPLVQPAREGETTKLHERLVNLPLPAEPVYVAVYEFPDETGQYKPSDTVTTYSRAVTQGAASMLIGALLEAGGGKFFSVVEREGLKSLLSERQIIRETRQRFLGQGGAKLPPPPGLLYAGILLEGGIVGYDSNMRTGGVGARFLGIGANTEYRQDIASVYLRAVSTQTGQVLASVVTQKTLFSYVIQGSAFRFISFGDLLEAEAGVTYNEPGLVALREAIELAVVELAEAGAQNGMWELTDATAASDEPQPPAQPQPPAAVTPKGTVSPPADEPPATDLPPEAPLPGLPPPETLEQQEGGITQGSSPKASGTAKGPQAPAAAAKVAGPTAAPPAAKAVPVAKAAPVDTDPATPQGASPSAPAPRAATSAVPPALVVGVNELMAAQR